MKISIYSLFYAMAERPAYWTGEVDISTDRDDFVTCERIFEFFNRVNEDDVIRLSELGYELPSMSFGDEITFDGKSFRVAVVGFERIRTLPERPGEPYDDRDPTQGDYISWRDYAEALERLLRNIPPTE